LGSFLAGLLVRGECAPPFERFPPRLELGSSDTPANSAYIGCLPTPLNKYNRN
jgi:hypothetical protein